MARLKSFFAVCMFAVLSLPAFSNVASGSTQEELRSEVAGLLKNLDLSNYDADEIDDTKVFVNFMITTSNEIVVLSTNNEDLDGLFKSRLNYQHLDTEGLENNKTYTIPVRVKI